LGVNTLLLLPIYDFDECMKDEEGNSLGKVNYWGYGKDAFYFAPKASYCSQTMCAARELKSLVKALHQNDMNIILDMYFVGQNPEFITQCLRYYALEFHVDGFRINQDSVDASWFTMDPILSHCKYIGSGWGDQPVPRGKERYLEMNDGFLVDARRFLKSDEGQTEGFYYRFREQREGVGQIHYITSNNGFTLRDLISYDVKHNEDNGERNQDGSQMNYSWNCGAEGYSRKKIVLKTRKQQERNALVMLLLGMATPMILAGDEFGNSQKGNNNAYCQDNMITWLDWRQIEKNKDTLDYVKMLLKFRREHPLYHADRKLTGADFSGLGAPDVSCHGREPWTADFSYYSRELGILYFGSYYGSQSLYFAFNFHWDKHEFYLPNVQADSQWEPLFSTADGAADKVEDDKYMMAPRSIAVFQKKVIPKPAQTRKRVRKRKIKEK